MPQPPRPPELREMQASPHWPKLHPVFKEGYTDARAGEWRNDYPARTLRWYAYEAGWDKGSDDNHPPTK